MTENETALATPAAIMPEAVQPVYRATLPSLKELAWMAQALAGTVDSDGKPRTPATVTLPKPLQGKPADVLAVMLAGRELGIGPMQSTRMIEIINGQTALRSELKLGLAKRAGHDIRPVIREQGRVRVQCVSCGSHEVEWALVRQGASPDAVIATEIEVEQWAGQGEQRRKEMVPLVAKSAWKSWDFAMLWARAVGQLCREHCPDAVGGLYSVEELGGHPKSED
jgi:hypothetical protein